MNRKCKNCFEWTDITPCEHCGMSPQSRVQTEEEIRDEVFDRLRGSPKKKMRAFANRIEKEYEDLMQSLDRYVEYNGNEGIYLGIDTPYEQVGDMWNWYELITGKTVPYKIRDNPFSCSC